MKCPYCSAIDDSVIDSRLIKENTVIRRRRECNSCHERFTTYERIEENPLMVIKSNNELQDYDRTKILNGLLKSCQKRPIKIEDLEKIVDELEKHIQKEGIKQIYTKDIGEYVMKKLKEIDKVAYVRFASVYKDFKTIDEFIHELKVLIGY